MGFLFGKFVSIEIVGEDFKVLVKILCDIKECICIIFGIIDFDDDVELMCFEILVCVDCECVVLFKIDMSGVVMIVRIVVNGNKVIVFCEGDEEYDIIVKFFEECCVDVNGF